MLELEPIEALTLSLHHSPGVYALLVGSGLSRAAGIPTGWEITLSLIRELGALDGIKDHPDWEAWYQSKYNIDPNYSEILDLLAHTPSERRAILHRCIEPAEGEGARLPTKAHRAIAQLVVDGFVRVILTTNFDRLIENALREAGIEPTVIASEDALAGATPLVHARCTVIKLHGDYLDARIKNTETEVGSYAPTIDSYLDEVFDRFGLLVVGWSGEWDIALRAAILRTSTRRYQLYWAARGPITQLGQDIIAHRDGRSFAIADADSFFTHLGQSLEALRQADQPHPLSAVMAVALAKRYCRDDRFSLEWTEFVTREVLSVRSFIIGQDYPRERPTPDSVNGLIETLISLSGILRRACLVCGRWGTTEANRTVVRAIRSLGFSSEMSGGYSDWIRLRDLCASLCFYWTLAGTLNRRDFTTARLLMDAPTRGHDHDEAFVYVLPLQAWSDMDWKILKGREKAKTPASDFLFDLFKRELLEAAIDPSDAEELFDQLELLISLEYAHRRIQKIEDDNGLWFSFPIGRYSWKGGRKNVFDKLRAYDHLSQHDELLQAGLLGGTPENASKTAEAVSQFFRANPNLTW
jgi:SIR2-like domain